MIGSEFFAVQKLNSVSIAVCHHFADGEFFKRLWIGSHKDWNILLLMFMLSKTQYMDISI